MDVRHYSSCGKDAGTLINLGHIAQIQDNYRRGLNGLRIAEQLIEEKGCVTSREYDAECLKEDAGLCCGFDTLRDNGLTAFDDYVKVQSQGWHIVTEEEVASRKEKWLRENPYRRPEWYSPRVCEIYSVVGSENLISESKIEKLKGILGEDYVEKKLKPRYEGMGTYTTSSYSKSYVLIPEAVAAYRAIADTILAIEID